jgi:hypothetical protein
MHLAYRTLDYICTQHIRTFADQTKNIIAFRDVLALRSLRQQRKPKIKKDTYL